MKIKTLLTALSFILLTSIAQGEVVKSFDSKNNCNLYRVTSEDAPRTSTEVTVLGKDVYGLSLQDMDIHFDTREVQVDLIANVVLGLNKRIGAEKVKILESNQEFKNLVNLLNRKIYLLEKACVDSSNILVYGSLFETKD